MILQVTPASEARSRPRAPFVEIPAPILHTDWMISILSVPAKVRPDNSATRRCHFCRTWFCLHSQNCNATLFFMIHWILWDVMKQLFSINVKIVSLWRVSGSGTRSQRSHGHIWVYRKNSDWCRTIGSHISIYVQGAQLNRDTFFRAFKGHKIIV